MALWIEPPVGSGAHWAQTTRPCGAGLIQLLRPAQALSARLGAPRPSPTIAAHGREQAERFGLTVKGEWWPSAGAPSWGGRIMFSGIRATRGQPGPPARWSQATPAALSFKPKGSKPGSRALGGRLTALWRTSLPAEARGLGRQAARAVPHTAACTQSLLTHLGTCWSEARAEACGLRRDWGTGFDASGLGLFLVAHQSVLGAGGMVEVPQTWGRRGVAHCGGPCSPDVDLSPPAPSGLGWVLGTAPLLWVQG